MKEPDLEETRLVRMGMREWSGTCECGRPAEPWYAKPIPEGANLPSYTATHRVQTNLNSLILERAVDLSRRPDKHAATILQEAGYVDRKGRRLQVPPALCRRCFLRETRALYARFRAAEKAPPSPEVLKRRQQRQERARRRAVADAATAANPKAACSELPGDEVWPWHAFPQQAADELEKAGFGFARCDDGWVIQSGLLTGRSLMRVRRCDPGRLSARAAGDTRSKSGGGHAKAVDPIRSRVNGALGRLAEGGFSEEVKGPEEERKRLQKNLDLRTARFTAAMKRIRMEVRRTDVPGEILDADTPRRHGRIPVGRRSGRFFVASGGLPGLGKRR